MPSCSCAASLALFVELHEAQPQLRKAPGGLGCMTAKGCVLWEMRELLALHKALRCIGAEDTDLDTSSPGSGHQPHQLLVLAVCFCRGQTSPGEMGHEAGHSALAWFQGGWGEPVMPLLQALGMCGADPGCTLGCANTEHTALWY